MGQLADECWDVGGFYNFQELVGGIVLQASDGGGGVEEGEAFLLAEGYDFVYLEAFVLQINKVVFIAKEQLSLDTPVVVDEVGVIEVHTPPLTLWRKAAEEQYTGIVWQERKEWMIFYAVLASCDVFYVQIRGHRLLFVVSDADINVLQL